MEHLLEIIKIYDNKKSSLVEKLRQLVPQSKLTSSHLNNWIYRDKKIPSEWVLPVCEAADWFKTPNQLRPDLYPHPNDGLPAHLRTQEAA